MEEVILLVLLQKYKVYRRQLTKLIQQNSGKTKGNC